MTATVITPSGHRRQVRLQKSENTKDDQSKRSAHDRLSIWRTYLEEEEERLVEEDGLYTMYLQDRAGNDLSDRPIRFNVQKPGTKRTDSIRLQLSGRGLRHAVVGQPSKTKA